MNKSKVKRGGGSVAQSSKRPNTKCVITTFNCDNRQDLFQLLAQKGREQADHFHVNPDDFVCMSARSVVFVSSINFDKICGALLCTPRRDTFVIEIYAIRIENKYRAVLHTLLNYAEIYARGIGCNRIQYNTDDEVEFEEFITRYGYRTLEGQEEIVYKDLTSNSVHKSKKRPSFQK